uniref:Large envelope protein n=3 Tax=Hepatitis B virus TaxID=10407 RepID=A0A1P8PF64_HBV|nr:large S protein [Hepatitis B virus]
MGGWSSKPRQGMGTNLSVPNPLGFFPDHQLDPAFGANSNNPDWDFNPNKDHWPEANQVGAGAFGPGFTPPHGGLLGWSPQAQGILTTVPAAPPPASTNRQSGRQPTPISPPLRDSHPQAMQWNSTTFHQALLDPRVRGLCFPAGGSSSGTVNPVPTTASPISSIFSKIGDPAPNMESTTLGFLGPLLVLQAGFFLLTRILTIPQSLDSWWTSLNFLGGAPTCPGQNSQSPTSNHSPTSCPPICPGYRWMCLRRFIIFLFILLLCLIFLLVLLDYHGMLPVCPLLPGTSNSTKGPCRTCTITAQGTSMFPSCCCTKPSDGNCTCIPIPSSWAFAGFLWGWASVRFSWLSLLVPFVQWFVGLSPTVWLSVIWMMWYWGPSLYNILSPFLPLLPLFFCLWVSI